MARLTPKIRKEFILTAALTVAETVGYREMTREQIGEAAQCAPALVSKYFGTMLQLRRAIMGAAIDRRNLNIIAQGLVNGDPRAKKAPQHVKQAAANSIVGV